MKYFDYKLQETAYSTEVSELVSGELYVLIPSVYEYTCMHNLLMQQP